MASGRSPVCHLHPLLIHTCTHARGVHRKNALLRRNRRQQRPARRRNSFRCLRKEKAQAAASRTQSDWRCAGSVHFKMRMCVPRQADNEDAKEARRVTKQIDEQLQKEKQVLRSTHRLLLLGKS